MRPFRVAQRKKNLQLKKSSFNLKDFFSKIIESPDKMYPKLESMLNKNSDTLHAFIELGGLSKIYEYLQHYYHQNDFLQIIKWLKLLNHDNFPIDVELIKQIGLGNFLSKQIKIKSKQQQHNDLIKLTSSIEQKWYKFAKKEKQEIQQRDKNRKRVSIPQKNYKMTISFKKYDKPSMINHGKYHNNHNNEKVINIEPILKCKNKNNDNNNDHNGYNHNHNRDLMEFQDHNDDKYELEYVEMEDNDIEMDGNNDKYQSTDDDDDDDIDLNINSNNYNNNNNINHRNNTNNTNNNNNNKDKEIEMDLMEEEVIWYTPSMININNNISQYTENMINNTDATKQEEERIKHKDFNNGSKCVELDSSRLTNNDINNKIVQVLTDYPHVCFNQS